MRTADVVTRFGGEEFALVLVGTGVAGAYTLCERLRQAVEQLEVPHGDWKAVVGDIERQVLPHRPEADHSEGRTLRLAHDVSLRWLAAVAIPAHPPR